MKNVEGILNGEKMNREYLRFISTYGDKYVKICHHIRNFLFRSYHNVN